MKRAVVLLNLGTPDSPSPDDVGKYLEQFLMDPFVVDIPAPLRWILVHLFIVPKRKFLSSKAYELIWTNGDSPLRIHLHSLALKLREELKQSKFFIAQGMRYGSPSMQSALKECQTQGCDEILVIPLYPQYSWAATESSIHFVNQILRKLSYEPKVKFLPPFYNRDGFLNAFSIQIQKNIPHDRAFILFSYHGLPVRHL